MKALMKYGKWVFLAALVVAVILLAPTLTKLTPQDIVNYTPKSPLLTALVLVGIYCAKSVIVLIPTYGLYIAGGMLLPAGWAILVAYLGLAAEMSLGFFFGRWLGRDKVLALAEKYPKSKRFVSFMENNSQLVCFITRLFPMPYPVDLGSMFFGATGMPYIRHLLFSLLGFSALMVPLTFMGGALDDPLSPRFLVPLAVSAVVVIGLFIAYTVWSKKREGMPQSDVTATPGED